MLQRLDKLFQKGARTEQQVMLDAADEMFDNVRAVYKANLPDGPELYAKLRDVASLQAETIQLIEQLYGEKA